eukprot:scpid54913/ scgid18698/ Neurogenic locus Notch protein; Processed neurogenic locus Notch protein
MAGSSQVLWKDLGRLLSLVVVLLAVSTVVKSTLSSESNSISQVETESDSRSAKTGSRSNSQVSLRSPWRRRAPSKLRKFYCRRSTGDCQCNPGGAYLCKIRSFKFVKQCKALRANAERVGTCLQHCKYGQCVVTPEREIFCDCDAEHTGTYCNISVEPSSPARVGASQQDSNLGEEGCPELPCQNGATCLHVGGRRRCKCTDGYSGMSCEDYTFSLAADEMTMADCENNCEFGDCEEWEIEGTDHSFAKCACHGAYTGKYCADEGEEVTEPENPQRDDILGEEDEGFTGSDGSVCRHSDCLNDGECGHFNDGSIGCHCLPNYSGSRCEDFTGPRRRSPGASLDAFSQCFDKYCQAKKTSTQWVLTCEQPSRRCARVLETVIPRKKAEKLHVLSPHGRIRSPGASDTKVEEIRRSESKETASSPEKDNRRETNVNIDQLLKDLIKDARTVDADED